MESVFQLKQTPNIEENASKYKDLIPTLPRENGWNSQQSSDFYCYQGFWNYAAFLEGVLSVQEQFQAKSSDIIIASAPKTGATWVKALAFAIVTRKRFDDSTSPLLVKVPHEVVPFLEFDLVDENRYNRDPEISLISTHMPFTSLPKSIVREGCKIVYIWRDPKDTFVSLWHFFFRHSTSFGCETVTLEEAFEMFCKGISWYGPYPDHISGYWNARLENPDKILFLKYEEMMEDTVFHAKKLAEFVGYPFTVEEEENGLLQNIVDMCSFEKLSNLEVNKSDMHREGSAVTIQNKLFFRKAQVGDWCNYLTDEMGGRLDLIMKNKLKGTGLIIN